MIDKFKLNNHGWGLQAMLAGILVLLIALVIVAILVDNVFNNKVTTDDDSSIETSYVETIKNI